MSILTRIPSKHIHIRFKTLKFYINYFIHSIHLITQHLKKNISAFQNFVITKKYNNHAKKEQTPTHQENTLNE